MKRINAAVTAEEMLRHLRIELVDREVVATADYTEIAFPESRRHQRAFASAQAAIAAHRGRDRRVDLESDLAAVARSFMSGACRHFGLHRLIAVSHDADAMRCRRVSQRSRCVSERTAGASPCLVPRMVL